MGKKSNFTGLSRFVHQAFGDQETTTKKTDESFQHPAKRRKVETGTVVAIHRGAEGLVPHYRSAEEVPEHLQKYFSQRKRYFSLYDQGCLLDEEGWYSVTPERIADQIAERCRCDTVLDAFCGVGGNAIAFAKTCERVIALDTSPVRLALARHNAQIYGVADRIEFILADYISFAESYLSRASGNGKRDIDIVFLSPPWGGISYLTNPQDSPDSDESDVSLVRHPEYSLASVKPIHGADLFHLTRRITPNVAYFLPRHTSLDELSALLPSSDATSGGDDSQQEILEIEEEWMGSKLKALTCYFGGLAAGQEHLF
ncbi:Tgs1 protein [Coniophora puteana RWD-64-598 SS2]|uniref:Trimethylguanosine synthase n=1 Tax=Coniophora puteana (strain RWD-64-598) TaxID=741705 RepID=A0A5M3M832_CONPW|nr:Tgs1 protein [Coniophora puteana RWD-64-598 SS2]EIW75329.1 Tgs1 protein [Coniophora puteana RWD-64-598 SS2]